ncbi:hypothetical protein GJ496_002703 [Pomphorhynchus laevis]|nr:hypothetical protein GJ496_002703 [Pomphorhynchus laevis]
MNIPFQAIEIMSTSESKNNSTPVGSRLRNSIQRDDSASNSNRNMHTQTDLLNTEEYEAILEVTERYLLRSYICAKDGKYDLPQRILSKETVICQNQKITNRIQLDQCHNSKYLSDIVEELKAQNQSKSTKSKNTTSRAIQKRSVNTMDNAKINNKSTSKNDQLVFAKWKDNCYYPGTVVYCQLPSDKLQVHFYDGHKFDTNKSDVYSQKIIKEGIHIMVSVRRNCYEPASIISRDTQSEMLCKVKMDNGQTRNIHFKEIMITRDQLDSIVDEQTDDYDNDLVKRAEKLPKLIYTTDNGENINCSDYRSIDGLFHNYTFVITVTSRNDRLESKKLSDNKNEMEIKDDVDKKYVRKLITSNGGVVCEEICYNTLVSTLKAKINCCNAGSMKQTHEENGHSKFLLISNVSSRTVKYLIAVAIGIPCISYKWIIASLAKKEIMPYDKFLLPRGVLLETGLAVKCDLTKKCPLNYCKAIIVSNNEEFRVTCEALLIAAGADIALSCFEWKEIDDELQQLCDFVITNDQPPSDILYNKNNFNAKILTLEWIIQCIIAGESINPKAQSAFFWP